MLFVSLQKTKVHDLTSRKGHTLTADIGRIILVYKLVEITALDSDIGPSCPMPCGLDNITVCIAPYITVYPIDS